MDKLDSLIIEPIENGFDAVGAMQGEMAPLKRAAIGAALGAAVVYGIKPSVAYDKNGVARPFAGTATAGQKDNATWLPYWAIIGIPAVVFSVFI
jgi:hypothetical protein